VSFAALISEQVQGAMQILGTEEGGLAATNTYIEVSSDTTYNTATGMLERVDVRHEDVPMVLARFKIEEMDESVVPTTDRKALIAALDLPIVPKEDDLIELRNGMIYEVKKLMGVPGNSLWMLHVRFNQIAD